MRIGFNPSIYNVQEGVSNVSVCANVSAVTGNVRTTNIGIQTTDGGEIQMLCCSVNVLATNNH
jgi:hypothetical protein